MRQKNFKNNTFFKTVPFTSIFVDTIKSHQLWISGEPMDNTSIFTGKLLVKIDESWENWTLDLHPEKLYRKEVGFDDYQYCQLQACFLKKFTHYDPTLPNYRHGIRLQFGQHLLHFLADSVDQFKKWFSLLRRFCIIDKFNRKYKLVGKLKYNDPIFGQCCFSCVRIQDAEYYIAKIIEKGLLIPQQKQNLFREISNLRRLSHTQITYFVELFEDDTHIYLIYEYFAGIDLRTYLKESQIYQMAEQSTIGLDEKLLSEIVYGLLQAINHMHQKGIFHRDIKLDNLLIPERKRLPFLLLNNFCYSEQWINEQQVFKKCGTPGFVAPEIFKTKNYTPKVDIFSLGVVFFILVFGRLPFEGKDQEEILKSNERADVDFKQEKKLCKQISKSGLDLLKGMLLKDPIKRHGAASALNHHWFIKMGTKKGQKNQLQPQRGRSLSTIVENSVDITQSFYQTNSNSRGLSLSKRNDEDRVEKEFVNENLHDKIQWKGGSFEISALKQIMSQFQDFISNKQLLSLQDEVKSLKKEIEFLQANQRDTDEIDEVLLLRDQIIRLNQDKFHLKEILHHKQQSGFNVQFERDLEQFFEWFNINQKIKKSLKLNIVIDQFIELQKNNVSLQSQLKKIKDLEQQVQELNDLNSKLENKIAQQQKQIEKQQKEIQNLLSLLDQKKTEQYKQDQYWDLIIECDSLKQLYINGWKYQINYEFNKVQSQIFIFSENNDLLNKMLKTFNCSKYIIDSHAYMKQFGQTIYIFKSIQCTNQPISYIKKSNEALDEYFMMFALTQNAPINILSKSQDYNLWNKLEYIKTQINSQSTINLNAEDCTSIIYDQNIQLPIISLLEQFTIQASQWFFNAEQELTISNINNTIQLNSKGKIQVKPDRATIKLHYIGDYYQLSDKLYVCLQKPQLFQNALVKPFQVNGGVILQIQVISESGTMKKVCQIFNYIYSGEYVISSDENYIYVTL